MGSQNENLEAGLILACSFVHLWTLMVKRRHKMICICDHTWWLFEFLLSVLFDCATWFRRALENSVHGGFRNAVFSCSSFHAESGLFRFLDYFEFLFDGETRREPTALPCISILEQNPWSRSCQKIKSRFLSWIRRKKTRRSVPDASVPFLGGYVGRKNESAEQGVVLSFVNLSSEKRKWNFFARVESYSNCKLQNEINRPGGGINY